MSHPCVARLLSFSLVVVSSFAIGCSNGSGSPTAPIVAAARPSVAATSTAVASATPSTTPSATVATSATPTASPTPIASATPVASPTSAASPMPACASPVPVASSLFYVATNNSASLIVGAGDFTGTMTQGFGIVAGQGNGIGLAAPAAIAVAPLGNVYVTNFATGNMPAGVQEYAPNFGCSGPYAVLAGSNVGNAVGSGIAVDESGYVYYATEGSPRAVSLFSPLVAGLQNTAPVSAITLAASTSNNADGLDVALDASGLIYVLGDQEATITVYPARIGSSLSAMPLATISGSMTRLNGSGGGIAIDRAGYIYALNSQSSAQPGIASILVFAPNPTGTSNEAPVAQIVGSLTQLVSPVGIAVDHTGVIYVADAATKSILEFAPSPQGTIDEAPMAVVKNAIGSATLYAPYGVASH